MSNQLVKKDYSEGYRKVFPKTFIDAIKDRETGMTLAEILQGFNMYFLSYNGNKAETRNQIPPLLRKEGLWITYVLYDHTVVSEWYDNSKTDDDSWGSDENWRIASNALVGDISVSSDGYWVINGIKTASKAQGERGTTPLLRIYDNKLQVSYTDGKTYNYINDTPVYTKFKTEDNKLQMSTDLGNTWETISDYIAAQFRWTQEGTSNNIGKIQISRDEGKTWSNLTNSFSNNLHISRYIGANESLPTAGVAEGTIYMKGPYYDENDANNDYPIYRMWVYAWKGNTLAWQDNGEFQSVVAGVVQERGDSELNVMSQAAITKELTELESESVFAKAGKNLLSPQKRHLGNWINAEGGLANVTQSYGYYDYIKIDGDTTYYISNKNGRTLTDRSDNYIAFYDVDKNFISAIKANTLLFTSPLAAVYVRLSFDVVKEDGLEPMLNKGHSRGEFEPFNPIEGYVAEEISEIKEEISEIKEEIPEIKIKNEEQDKRTTIIESKVGYVVSDVAEINNSEGANLINVTLIPGNTPFKWRVISDNLNGRTILTDNTGTRLYDGLTANVWYDSKVMYDITTLRLSNYSGASISVMLEVKWGLSLDSEKIESERIPREEYISKDVFLSAGGSFDSFGTFLCGWGYGSTAGQYLTITPTEIQIYSRGTTSYVNHGLTIDKYIAVSISTNSEKEAYILIQSGNGQNYYNKIPWLGRGIPFSVFRDSENAKSYGVKVMRKRIQSPTWIYGDSYMSYDTSYRWPYHILFWGYDNWHANHSSGGNSEQLMPAFKADLLCGKPLYALWLLGMNDGADTDINTPSEKWLNNIKEFISICKDKNITPILATIPSVPTIYHEGKNKWVRESGYRYIDFADAVGASADGQWTSGMLYVDGVHPEPSGARALAMRVLVDFPEITIL